MALSAHLSCESEDSVGGDISCMLVSVRSELIRAFRAHAYVHAVMCEIVVLQSGTAKFGWDTEGYVLVLRPRCCL